MNCASHSLPKEYAVDESYNVFVAGEVAALVVDWRVDSVEVWARRQNSSDRALQCSGAVEIFQLSSVCAVEQHIIGETQCHAYTGFVSTSSDWKTPFITSWMSTRRRDANHLDYKWEQKTDPQMKKLKSVFLSSLPCSLARFDIVRSSKESMHELAFISDLEKQGFEAVDDPCLHNFELLVLQFLSEVNAPNWKRVNVIFVSNWRVLASKRLTEGFGDFLLENTWYLERFDFDDLMFTLGANVAVLENVEDLKIAETVHDILVSVNFMNMNFN